MALAAGCDFKHHLFLRCTVSTLFGERKELRVHKFPIRAHAPQAQPSKPQTHDQTGPQGSPRGLPKKDHLPPLTISSEASTETKPSHHILTVPVSFSSFLPSLLSPPLFASFFFILIAHFHLCFLFLSPYSKKSFMHSLILSNGVTFFLWQRPSFPQDLFL